MRLKCSSDLDLCEDKIKLAKKMQFAARKKNVFVRSHEKLESEKKYQVRNQDPSKTARLEIVVRMYLSKSHRKKVKEKFTVAPNELQKSVSSNSVSPSGEGGGGGGTSIY